MKHYINPKESRNIRGMSGTGKSVATLVEGLSVSFHQNNNYETNHNDMTIKIPLSQEEFNDKEKMRGIESPPVRTEPFIVPAPTVVSPVQEPSRNIGAHICDVVSSYDELKILGEVLGGFTGPSPPEGTVAAAQDHDDAPPPAPTPTYSIQANVSGIRFYWVDPVLGLHLPVGKVCVPDLKLSMSQLEASSESLELREGAEGGRGRERSLSDDGALRKRTSTGGSSVDLDLSLLKPKESQLVPSFQVGADLHMWAEYFNNTLNCWEPMLEPYVCVCLYEKCTERGQGLVLRANCPLHVNLSGAFFDTLDDALEAFSADTKDEVDNEIKSVLKKKGPPTHGDTWLCEPEKVRECRGAKRRSTAYPANTV